MSQVKLWAGAVASACVALVGVSVVPHPYDKAVMGLGAVAGAIFTYLMHPPTGASQ